VPGGFFLLFLVPGVIGAVAGDGSPGWKALVFAGFVVYGAAYLLIPVTLWPAPVRARTAAVLGMLAVGGALVAVLGTGALTLMVYATGMAAVMLPALRGILLNGLVLAALFGWLVFEGTLRQHGGELITLLSVSIALLFMGELVRANAQLREARDEVARLAVAEERARFARDLHDVLGHSLTTITVKAGLARRVLQSEAGSERAITEVHEVEQLARQALTEVRATVSGYREASLAAELAGARAALQAAEIEAVLPHAVDNVAADLQRVFAYVLREGVTNVLRHSAATRCEVRFGRDWVEISDNGRGAESTVDGGHGLAGLRERLAGVGGTLAADPLPAGGFRLRAAVSPAAVRHEPGVSPAPRPSMGIA
jgi:two-component system sensor histidine kinase DesK